MSEPYHEVVVAPTNRSKCKQCRPKHNIEAGELKLVSWYIPNGRNHLESVGRSLVCINKESAKAILNGRTKNGVRVYNRLNERDNPGAFIVSRSICEAIASGLPVSDADKGFRYVLPKPVRNRQEKAPRKCSVCTVNFPRVGEYTCNACRPQADIDAEMREKAEGESINKHINEVLDTIQVDCACGKHARLIPEWDGFWDARVMETVDMDMSAMRVHADKMLAEYRGIVEAVEDKRCEACAA